MILSATQSARFAILFDPLIDYLSEEYRKANPTHAAFESREEEIDTVCGYVWRDEGHLDLIDRYLEENPSISPANQQAIIAFKSGLYDAFPVACIDADTYFLYGSQVFSVCGLSVEIEPATKDESKAS